VECDPLAQHEIVSQRIFGGRKRLCQARRQRVARIGFTSASCSAYKTIQGVMIPGVSAGSNQVGASVVCTPQVNCPCGPPQIPTRRRPYRKPRALRKPPGLLLVAGGRMRVSSCDPATGPIRPRLSYRTLNQHHLKRNRKFVDSPLEEDGFEPSVPRGIGRRYSTLRHCTASSNRIGWQKSQSAHSTVENPSPRC